MYENVRSGQATTKFMKYHFFERNSFMWMYFNPLHTQKAINLQPESYHNFWLIINKENKNQLFWKMH